MILIYSRDAKVAARIAGLLSMETGVCETTPQLLREVERVDQVGAVVLGEDLTIEEARLAAEELRIADPSIAALLIRNRVDLGVTTDAMRSGIRSVIGASDIKGLVEQVEEQNRISLAIRAKRDGQSQDSAPGKVVLVYSAKGGVGKTTTSLNIAVGLAEASGGTVAVLDMDLQFGDVGVAAGISDSTKSISDLIGDPAMMTTKQLLGSMEKIDSKLSVLLAPQTPAEAADITPELVSKAIELLRANFDWVVIDSPPAFTDEILAAFDRSDLQVILSTPDLPAIKNLAVAANTLERIGLDKTQRCVVINRYYPKVGLDRGEVVEAARKIAGTQSVVVVPESADILKSSSLGFIASLGPRGARVRKLYKDLVGLIIKSFEQDSKK